MKHIFHADNLVTFRSNCSDYAGNLRLLPLATAMCHRNMDPTINFRFIEFGKRDMS